MGHNPARNAAAAATPRYITIDEAATHLGVSPLTIRRRISSGDLPAFKMGRRAIRVRIEDVEALLEPIPTAGGGRA